MFDQNLSRRELLVRSLQAGALLALGGCSRSVQGTVRRGERAQVEPNQLVIATGAKPAKMVQAALKPLGGIERFVRKGDQVLLKPNFSWARTHQQGAVTDPDLVAAVVDLCRKAGASQVTVFDHMIDRPARLVVETTGIRRAVDAAGARLALADDPADYHDFRLPAGKVVTREQVFRPVLEADVLINMPIAKCHSATGITGSLKNMMGCIWNRQAWHDSESLHRCIAEFSAAVRPNLVIVDAQTVLLTNGPKGPGETRQVGEVVVTTDPVAADCHVAELIGLSPSSVIHLAEAAKLGVGQLDQSKLKVTRVRAGV